MYNMYKLVFKKVDQLTRAIAAHNWHSLNKLVGRQGKSRKLKKRKGDVQTLLVSLLPMSCDQQQLRG